MCNYSDAIYRMGMEAEREASAQKAAMAMEEQNKRIAQNLFAYGISPEAIAKNLETSLEKVQEWLNEKIADTNNCHVLVQ